MSAFRIVIPARYQSTRLPGKVLEKIANKTILQHVYERAKETNATSIVIATDHPKVVEIAQTFTEHVILTSPHHRNATDRIAEVAKQLHYADDDIVVNLQADEPFMPANIIQKLADHLSNHASSGMATLAGPINNPSEIFNPHIVKVILDKNNQALYFSRAPIPWDRERFPKQLVQLSAYYHHHGLYAYYVHFIHEYVKWDHCEIEQLECLEQLRALYQGTKIQVMLIPESLPPGIDTLQDLEEARKYYHSLHGTLSQE